MALPIGFLAFSGVQYWDFPTSLDGDAAGYTLAKKCGIMYTMENSQKRAVGPRKYRRFGARSKAKFLEMLVLENGIQSQALLRMTGLGRTARGQPARWATLKKAQRDDLAFMEACQLIIDQAADALEAEVVRRALGVASKMYASSGKPVIDPATGQHAEIIRYSDGLLLKALAAIRPGKWADRQNVHHTGQVELASARHWQIATTDMQHLTKEEQEQLGDIMIKVRDGRAALTRDDAAQRTIEHDTGAD